jgi:hypothetical protein
VSHKLRLIIPVLFLSSALLVNAQQSSPTPDGGVQVHNPTGVTLLEDNSDVRIVRFDVPDSVPKVISTSGRDAVMVVLADVSISSGSSQAETLQLGEARFLQREKKYSATGVAIVIELKQHRDRPMKYCEPLASCTHQNFMGAGQEVSSTTTLFGNGFTTVMRYNVVRQGSLDSSYYSAKGKDSVIFVPLTDVKVQFDGVEEQLNLGQAYFSNASAVSVEGGEKGAMWVVVRLNQPKTP